MSNEELVIKYKSGNEEALNQLIDTNQGIIYKIANKYKNIAYKNGMEFEDLLQCGHIGLLKSVRLYNPEHENSAKFSTYVVSAINREIYNAINGRTSRQNKNIKLNFDCRSLSESVKNSDGEVTLEETIQCEVDDYKNIEEQLYLKQLREELECIIYSELTLREREIIFLKYGWFKNEGMSYEELSEVLNSRKSIIENIERSALKDLRKTSWCETRGKEYYKELRDSMINEYEIKGIGYLDKCLKRLL